MNSTGVGYGGESGIVGHGANAHAQVAHPGILAFTGLDLALLCGVALVLLCAGVALSRLVAR